MDVAIETKKQVGCGWRDGCGNYGLAGGPAEDSRAGIDRLWMPELMAMIFRRYVNTRCI